MKPGVHDLERPSDDVWGPKWIHGRPFFACFLSIRFSIRIFIDFYGFEGRKGTIFYSIFVFFAARAIFANCELYLRKTHMFHAWEVSFSKIFKLF